MSAGNEFRSWEPREFGLPLALLAYARDAQLPPFNIEMAEQPHVFLVPAQIQPAND
jgi:hypothetical protein